VRKRRVGPGWSPYEQTREGKGKGREGGKGGGEGRRSEGRGKKEHRVFRTPL